MATLGEDVYTVDREAQENAGAKGFCKAVPCTLGELKRWARTTGFKLKGPVGAYAKALAGMAGNARDAADAAAVALGVGASKLRKEAEDAARGGGFCKGSTCTDQELAVWGRASTAGLQDKILKTYSSVLGAGLKTTSIDDILTSCGKAVADSTAFVMRYKVQPRFSLVCSCTDR